MAKYKNILTDRLISSYEYEQLSSSDQVNYRRYEEGDDFMGSAVIGGITDNAILGGVLGGSFTGGIIGDILIDGELF